MFRAFTTLCGRVYPDKPETNRVSHNVAVSRRPDCGKETLTADEKAFRLMHRASESLLKSSEQTKQGRLCPE